LCYLSLFVLFAFNYSSPPDIYTLSLHDALPIFKSVFAVLPFGETLPLKFLAAAGVWEGRFLAPAWMADGSYRCRLLLTDAAGNGDRKSTRLNSSHSQISYAVFCLKKKKKIITDH